MPTTIQFYPHSSYVLAGNLLKYPSISKIAFLAQRFRDNDFVSFVANVAESCLRDRAAFHLWGHSWEVDEYKLWQPLDQVLRILGGLGGRAVTLGTALDCLSPTPSDDGYDEDGR
jgi:hypothetical protein